MLPELAISYIAWFKKFHFHRSPSIYL